MLLHGNSMADKLPKEGVEDTSTYGTSLTFHELFINRMLLENLYQLAFPIAILN